MVGADMIDGRADFDFYIGDWTVQNRRLTNRLQGSDDWEEFTATSRVRPLLGGLANIDEIAFDCPLAGLRGFSIGLFHPASRQWYLYWADDASGELFAPMVGEFEDARGEFYAHHVFEGRRVFSRSVWSDITPDGFHWEYAYSNNGGETWETNWTMIYTRNGSMN